ncbi:MAG TPA: Pvc16 family protein, partial [Bacteroidales bacterium]|nr:Pvc16 family protein [Bacteroidales bacterium]
KNDYKEALKQISCLIKIFQGKHVFEKEDFAKYSEISGLESLIVELFSLSLEQNNSLWQTLGNKMVPSVMYKVKMVSIQDDKPAGESSEIRAIGIDIAHK